jgi:hypothetical protein
MAYIIVMLMVIGIFKFIVFTWEDNDRSKKARRRFLQELKRK